MNRAAYVEALKIQLRGWDQRIDSLSTLAKLANLDVQPELQARMVELLEKRDEFREKVSELDGAGEGDWEATRESVERTHRELTEEFAETKACLTV